MFTISRLCIVSGFEGTEDVFSLQMINFVHRKKMVTISLYMMYVFLTWTNILVISSYLHKYKADGDENLRERACERWNHLGALSGTEYPVYPVSPC